jgi:anti-anti-sigma factor
MEVAMSLTLVSPDSPVSEPVGPQAFACTLGGGGVGPARVYVAGELDIATCPRFERVLRRAERRANLVVVDLRKLTFMDSSGVHAITRATSRARGAGRQLTLLHCSPQVRRLFTLTGVGDVAETVDLEPFDPPANAA